ncbi:F-box/kelch-repeat protein At3g06240-like [Alnus glutinosa]|uniref:F-box/kelch-repeat protein At3g06240-like n=1 Tax=Alnus glutinosa TaxID=3517 RepID=UPI002D77E432|nr:F-box/kelch-repeat protein At3g06240-like [Alnus glutinosa]
MRGARDFEVLDCKGLILFTTRLLTSGVEHDYLESQLILWNPAIRMSMTLPQACIVAPNRSKYFVHGFGFDHTSNDYKVLRMVFGSDIRLPPPAQLYKLRTGAWETFSIADDFQYDIVDSDPQAFVNGACHWVGYSSFMESEYPEVVVVLFDMCDEELRVMKLPDRLTCMDTDYIVHVRLGNSGGLLCLMEHNPRKNVYWNWNIWLMKEYGIVESWTKQFAVDVNGSDLFSFMNNEKILGEKREKLVLYDLKTRRFNNLGGIKAKGTPFAMNTFVESLVLFNVPDLFKEENQDMHERRPSKAQ